MDCMVVSSVSGITVRLVRLMGSPHQYRILCSRYGVDNYDNLHYF